MDTQELHDKALALFRQMKPTPTLKRAQDTIKSYNAERKEQVEKVRPILVKMQAAFEKGETIANCTSLKQWCKAFRVEGVLSFQRCRQILTKKTGNESKVKSLDRPVELKVGMIVSYKQREYVVREIGIEEYQDKSGSFGRLWLSHYNQKDQPKGRYPILYPDEKSQSVKNIEKYRAQKTSEEPSAPEPEKKKTAGIMLERGKQYSVKFNGGDTLGWFGGEKDNKGDVWYVATYQQYHAVKDCHIFSNNRDQVIKVKASQISKRVRDVEENKSVGSVKERTNTPKTHIVGENWAGTIGPAFAYEHFQEDEEGNICITQCGEDGVKHPIAKTGEAPTCKKCLAAVAHGRGVDALKERKGDWTQPKEKKPSGSVRQSKKRKLTFEESLRMLGDYTYEQLRLEWETLQETHRMRALDHVKGVLEWVGQNDKSMTWNKNITNQGGSIEEAIKRTVAPSVHSA
jgi:hypothetical protein